MAAVDLQQRVAAATLFLLYSWVYDPEAEAAVRLCGKEPPPELVQAAGGEAVLDAVCGAKLSNDLAARVYQGEACL